MKDVLLQKKNLNIVVGHYKLLSNVNKTRAANASVIIITILFLINFLF